MKPTIKGMDELETRAAYAEHKLTEAEAKVRQLEWEVAALRGRQEALLYALQLMRNEVRRVQRAHSVKEFVALAG